MLFSVSSILLTTPVMDLDTCAKITVTEWTAETTVVSSCWGADEIQVLYHRASTRCHFYLVKWDNLSFLFPPQFNISNQGLIRLHHGRSALDKKSFIIAVMCHCFRSQQVSVSRQRRSDRDRHWEVIIIIALQSELKPFDRNSCEILKWKQNLKRIEGDEGVKNGRTCLKEHLKIAEKDFTSSDNVTT